MALFSKKKLKCILAAAAVLCLFLSSCAARDKGSEAAAPGSDISEYVLETEYKTDFRILQLTDIHLGNKDNRQLQYDFLSLTIKDADADMIVLDGDIFTFADRATARELFDFIDSWGIPWSVTFGNHDEQCYFSVDWLTAYLNSYGSCCIFKDVRGDDVFGYANYAVNLVRAGETVYQIIIMDSNRYYYGSYIGYDWIKQDQIDWYERLVEYTAAENGGITVPSICFFHIPFPEFAYAYEAVLSGDPSASLEYGRMGEDVSCPEYNSGLFDKILELGSTKAVCVGHDHTNNARLLYRGVYLVYGVNSNDRIYCDPDMMGGHVVVVHEDGSLDFEHIYHSYDELQQSY